MDINFTIDFDAGEMHIILDNLLSLSVYKDEEGYEYKGFNRIDDDQARTKLKEAARALFALDSY